MEAKTLSVLLGHASVAFTVDTYAHVLTDYKKESMMLMESLYDLGNTPGREISYPGIVTNVEDGTVLLEAPDFPGTHSCDGNLQQGLQALKEYMEEERLLSPFPPAPTPAGQIVLQPNQFLLQIPV